VKGCPSLLRFGACMAVRIMTVATLDPVFAHGVGCEWRLGDGLTARPFVSFSGV